MSDIYHSGVLHRSGRYKEGTGEDPYQCKEGIRATVFELRAKGVPDTDIAKMLGMSTTTMRQRISLEKEEEKAYQTALAVQLKAKGYSNTAIAERMKISEGTVRNLLSNSTKEKESNIRKTADVIREEVLKKGVVDIGAGNEVYLGISATKLKTAISLLKDEGFNVYDIKIQQMGANNKTTIQVMTTKDISARDIYQDPSRIKLLSAYSEDGGETIRPIEPPVMIDPDRVSIRYAEQGGTDRDGLIEIRRGVEDLSLGNARYAQVRIAVEGGFYLKGMAAYSDDLPPDVDIRFNTNKHVGVPKIDLNDPKHAVLKPMDDDPENPFGANIKTGQDLIKAQRHYIGTDGKEHQSALNIVNEEGDWSKWSKTLSSQFLSKQNESLVKKQLDISLKEKQEEFDSISKLNNPVIKKHFLDSFAEDCDAAAVHLKAAGMPRQASHVILPLPDMKPNEIYAPNYRDGEKVVLVRHPHAGRFELPELTVNNKNPQGKKLMGDAPDAVGIHPKVAEQLSGADFDGDTVLVIPNNSGEIKTRSPLKALNGFDPKAQYPKYPGMKVITEQQKQMEMGKISNLITDMTLGGRATDAEMARAVKHSMVIIDSKKHELNWKLSEDQNGIAELRLKYQGKASGGASTLISRSKSVSYVNERQEGKLVVDPVTGKKTRLYSDPKTGEKLYTETGRKVKRWNPKTGEWEEKGLAQEKSTKMAETKDARKLSSGTPIEEIYASYANNLKSMANQARKDSYSTTSSRVNPSAKKVYAPEVESLKAKLQKAKSNSPLERNAQAIANTIYNKYKDSHPDATKDALKRERGKALKRGREITGASKQRINISEKEWEAIQAGAISTNFLKEIVSNSDTDRLRALATPRASTELSPATIQKAMGMKDRGYSMSQIADSLGVSVATLRQNI